MPRRKPPIRGENGIGMSREEAISHLGTIARSGTAEFFKKLSGDQQKDSQLIGQFGVGFYSAFIVADRVEVLTRRAGLPASEGVHWASAADGEFFGGDPRSARSAAQPSCCTSRTTQRSFADAWHLRTLVRRVFGPHQLPGAYAEGGRRHGRIRGRQPRQGAVDAFPGRNFRTRSTRSSTSTSRTTR